MNVDEKKLKVFTNEDLLNLRQSFPEMGDFLLDYLAAFRHYKCLGALHSRACLVQIGGEG